MALRFKDDTPDELVEFSYSRGLQRGYIAAERSNSAIIYILDQIKRAARAVWEWL